MYYINQRNRNACAVVLSFLLVIGMVAYATNSLVSSLKASFSMRTQGERSLSDLYNNK